MAGILFLTTPHEDYLSDCVLHGLKELYGRLVVDYPKHESLYDTCDKDRLARAYGRGFTLYGSLDDEQVDRSCVTARLERGEFDIVVLGNIWVHFEWFLQHRHLLKPDSTIVLDGADAEALFPCHGCFWRRPRHWFLPRVYRHFSYFKREWTGESLRSTWLKLVPRKLSNYLPVPPKLHPISFAVPGAKIVSDLPPKCKLFPQHIVDPEVRSLTKDSRSGYAFDKEAGYYADLQSSRFGITMKRSGWDCLRHYEIAANGSVICFRDLSCKPATCAPHGLVDGQNCIAYSSASGLMKRIEGLSDADYLQLQRNTLAWARENSCSKLARRVLDDAGASALIQ